MAYHFQYDADMLPAVMKIVERVSRQSGAPGAGRDQNPMPKLTP